MKAITIWNPWAHLIAAGVKTYELRKWRPDPDLEGRRIVIHASVRQMEVAQLTEVINNLKSGGRYMTLKGLSAIPVLERLRAAVVAAEAAKGTLDLTGTLRSGVEPLEPVYGAGLGTAILGRPRRLVDVLADQGDRSIVDYKWFAWPLADFRPFVPPVPARGAQGLWNWPFSDEIT